MSEASTRGWKRDSDYCEATNRDGKKCGNKVARTPSGAVIYRKCAVHRRIAARDARAAEYRRVHGHFPGEVA